MTAGLELFYLARDVIFLTGFWRAKRSGQRQSEMTRKRVARGEEPGPSGRGRTRSGTRAKVAKEEDSRPRRNARRATRERNIVKVEEVADLSSSEEENGSVYEVSDEEEAKGQESSRSSTTTGASDEDGEGGRERAKGNGARGRRREGGGHGAPFLFSRWFEEEEVSPSGVTGDDGDDFRECYEGSSFPIWGLTKPGGSAKTPRKIELYNHSHVSIPETPALEDMKTAAKVKPPKDPTAPRNVKSPRECILDDVLVFCGGPVWSLAWSPAVRGGEGSDDATSIFYIAVGPHSLGHGLNAVNQVLSGPALIQILAVSCKGDPARITNVAVHSVARHRGAVTWDLAWCPDTARVGVGVLAAALGDGRVCVYSVRECVAGEGGPSHLSPKLSTSELRDRGSIPSCLAWHPQRPHSTLLVGCWDGSVAQLMVTPDRVDLVSFFKADIFALRRVIWCHDPADGEDGGARCEMYATCGNSGTLKLWNEGEPQHLLHSFTLARDHHIMAAELCKDPAGLVILGTDGRFHFLWCSESGFEETSKALAKNCPSSIVEKDGYFLLSNFAGDVCLFYGRQALYESGIGRSIKRITEHIVSSLTLDAESGSLRLDEGISETSLEKRDLNLNPLQQVHAYRSAWMPSSQGSPGTMGYAHAYGAGLLRVQLLDKKKCDRLYTKYC